MKISEIVVKLSLEVIQRDYPDQDITEGYTSDLLSDVMGNAPQNCLLISIQAHKNTVAVAGLINAPGLIICNNREITPEMIEAAKFEKIGLFRTKENQFQTSANLAKLIQ